MTTTTTTTTATTNATDTTTTTNIGHAFARAWDDPVACYMLLLKHRLSVGADLFMLLKHRFSEQRLGDTIVLFRRNTTKDVYVVFAVSSGLSQVTGHRINPTRS